ncbi:hypothetical protein U1Q18_032967 [Sarracenia purpurea var. burkii]
MGVAKASRRHEEVVTHRRVGCRGGTGTVLRRPSVINYTWSDGGDGGRRAVKKDGDTGVKGQRRGLGLTSRVIIEKGGAVGGIAIDPICKACGESEETVEHMLFLYREADMVWTLSPYDFRKKDDEKIGHAWIGRQRLKKRLEALARFQKLWLL